MITALGESKEEPELTKKTEVVKENISELPPHVLVDKEEDKLVRPKRLGKTKGTIFNCHYLRLREGATLRSKELVRIEVGTTVDINLDNSTESFYEVAYKTENGVLIGFCLKEFIKVGT